MKRALLYFVIVLLAFSSCRKEDDPAFELSPDERINQTLSQYQAALAGAPNGWNAELITATGSIYHFHFSFNDANRVQMFADIDTTTAAVGKESSFRLKALQQPALIFDTYSYIHILADPDGSVNGGPYGEGLSSDFEFSLDTLATDSIKLTGRFKGSKMVMRKATPQDQQAWQSGQWKSSLLFEYAGERILNYFKRLTVGGRQYEMRINTTRRTITFIWKDGSGAPQQHTSAYSFTNNGVQLATPLTDGANTISTLSNFTWNAGIASFHLNVNGGSAATIAGAIAPLVPDLAAPTRWWQFMASRDGYWVSVNGFHVDGVDDAYKIRSIPNFYYLIFYPVFNTEQGITYDLAGYVSRLNGEAILEYGTAFHPPVFTTNGRVIFSYLGDLGDIPPAGLTAYINTALLFNSADGFYLVQTSETTYDMVHAKDAKAWITWLQ